MRLMREVAGLGSGGRVFWPGAFLGFHGVTGSYREVACMRQRKSSLYYTNALSI
jgi:hypothetical protein